jgi:hypothetical protein
MKIVLIMSVIVYSAISPSNTERRAPVAETTLPDHKGCHKSFEFEALREFSNREIDSLATNFFHFTLSCVEWEF